MRNQGSSPRLLLPRCREKELYKATHYACVPAVTLLGAQALWFTSSSSDNQNADDAIQSIELSGF
jgi:hypothetical protein